MLVVILVIILTIILNIYIQSQLKAIHFFRMFFTFGQILIVLASFYLKHVIWDLKKVVPKKTELAPGTIFYG